jgi:hypothetical protein
MSVNTFDSWKMRFGKKASRASILLVILESRRSPDMLPGRLTHLLELGTSLERSLWIS